ncbi:hypothetical protein J6590_047697 [Homalodisca vitripennis]|nr:hypothetical protein J6590_047697 [Homalodisca vitripennis]
MSSHSLQAVGLLMPIDRRPDLPPLYNTSCRGAREGWLFLESSLSPVHLPHCAFRFRNSFSLPVTRTISPPIT